MNTLTNTNELTETETEFDELTVIHIITRPMRQYTYGWWARLEPGIYIRPVGSQDKLGLLYAYNIPIAPEKHFFNRIDEVLHFTLFFPALPKDTTHIDIVEMDGGDYTYYNFFNVSLDEINRKPIRK